MIISNKFTKEELDILKMYCGDKYVIVDEVNGESYVFDLEGKYSYDQCFKASNNDYYKKKRYNKVVPIKKVKFYNYYIMCCNEYKGMWFQGRIDYNGNFEYTTNSDKLEYVLQAL